MSDWSSDVCSSDLGGKIALAAADISTGRFEALCVEEHSLHAELARLRASEIVLAEDLVLDVAEAHPFERAAFDSSRAETQLKKLFGVATLDGFGQFRSEEHTSELQSLMRISYAVFCL